MRDAVIEVLADCANALGELLPPDHAHRSIVERANRLIGLLNGQTREARAEDALRDLIGALPPGTLTSMSAFRPDTGGHTAGVVKVLLMADNADDLRCAQSVITNGSGAR